MFKYKLDVVKKHVFVRQRLHCINGNEMINFLPPLGWYSFGL